ncbi:MAG: thioredoxin domain-containing protein [Thiobacillus sp.]|nr:thioredoxin domain-containing protein [Thiobacillus sp.]
MAIAAPFGNTLAGHASPYLALHGQDPVAWQEWNADTLARAKRENKLLFVSVGYFSCHWCHVMQQQSYRDPAIARLLNEHFIPVKVDRELNGALDAGLIDFAERLKGVAGWPLNAFVTPEGYPAYAVLYEPPAEFRQLLARMVETWREKGAAFRAAAREAGSAPREPPATAAVTQDAVARLHRQFLDEAWRQADTLQGGFERVSKFPMAPHLEALLDAYVRERDPRLGEFLTLTLDQMARKGLRDHVHGGFFRYTVDPDWTTPHFEKMLYDNAQLARLYARAAAVFKRPDYRLVAHDTLDFMLADLAAPGGGYYTALSALDRQGREGGAYLWTAEALRQRLSPAEFALVKRTWGLEAAAPFELGYLPMEKARPAAGEGPVLAGALAKLRQAGRNRQVPVDTKINAGLNGLALSALAEAGRGVPRFERAARELRDYLATRMVSQGRLLKTRAGKRVFVDAELEDYAFAAAGLADYARVFKDPAAGALARDLAAQAWQRFFTPRGWRREEQPLLATLGPEPALADGALPSPSALLMAVTRALPRDRSRHPGAGDQDRARAMLLPTAARAPFDHPGAMAALRGR